jgi:hypothetical protein
MLGWTKKESIPTHSRAAVSKATRPQGRVMSGPYLVLFEYLEKRYANRVVLTFAQIEDLLGAALPTQAHLDQEWWTDATVDVVQPKCSDAWLLAHRSATPNLPARVVVFARGS